MTERPPLFDSLVAEHRRLDDAFGRFLAALSSRDAGAARAAIADFDEALRRHTADEEDRIYPAAPGKPAPGPGDDARARLFRELRLEHVQVRELSGMVLRLLDEKGDLDGAARLAPGLARRWDAHTTREEREAFVASEGSR